MRQAPLIEDHYTDEAGNPSGGRTEGVGYIISWQHGPLVGEDGNRREPNGAFVEGVIEAALGRLRFYQSTQFICDENAKAIEYLELGLVALNARTRDREERGVEGTHEL